MADSTHEPPGQPAGAGAGHWLDQVLEMNQRFFDEALRMGGGQNGPGTSLWFDVLDGWRKFGGFTSVSPGRVIDSQMELWRSHLQIWQNTLQRLSGKDVPPLVTPEKGDHRFSDPEWSENPLFDYMKQAYLLTARGLSGTIRDAEGIDDKTRERLLFASRQWINSVAPTNFPLTNPEVLRLTVRSGGQNLARGFEQLVEDMEKSAEALNIRMTDESAFRIGENIATTPGKVVFRNRLFELLQYQPTTATVHRRPLLVVPPWINKFYILDLRESNSLVRWAVNAGHTVFVMSWANPSQAHSDVRMEDYMQEGLLTALDAVTEATGEPDANVIGYCAGGLLLAITQAWLAARGESGRVASATYLATLLDYGEPGDLGTFVDEPVIAALEKHVAGSTGIFDGRLLAVAFSLLRENDLYWNYYVQNYLKGERPVPFDLLYWNSDCTNLPGPTLEFFLRELYQGNHLREPGQVRLAGEALDLGRVTTPSFIFATLQDHITKWRACYSSVRLLGGPGTFVLGESGHIAGTINPPGGKYGYYRHDEYPASADEWFAAAAHHEGSWWLCWQQWIEPYLGEDVPARLPGGGSLPVLGNAPGEYVRVRARDAIAPEAAVDLSG